MKKVLILFFVFISCQNNEKFDLLDNNPFSKNLLDLAAVSVFLLWLIGPTILKKLPSKIDNPMLVRNILVIILMWFFNFLIHRI